MRKIEQAMVNAVQAGIAWSNANTMVTKDGTVYLHGNRIAYKLGSELVCDEATLSRWPTATTQSRLRALGFKVFRGQVIK